MFDRQLVRGGTFPDEQEIGAFISGLKEQLRVDLEQGLKAILELFLKESILDDTKALEISLYVLINIITQTMSVQARLRG
ncbi:unnamed protein product [Dovyalis caffra]|uniref:Uncharacterized protein n=1 Tax=Dovyalis caffra TaxID=77055 RepID=A0AAV1SRH3_9ROSI|nr:unnamed protein product [Dovyalis caffra]